MKNLFKLICIFILWGARSTVADDPTQKVSIVAFGDSTTAIRSTIQKVYAVRLRDNLAAKNIEAVVHNAGVGGSHTGKLVDNERHKRQHALDRFDKSVRSHKPRIVIIQFGWNDSWVDANDPKAHSRIPLENYTANLDYMCSVLKKDGAKVILMTPNRPELSMEQWRVARTLQYVKAVRILAKTKDLALVDVWDAYEQFNKLKSQSSDELLLDSVHPNDKGHQLVADLLFKLILKSNLHKKKIP